MFRLGKSDKDTGRYTEGMAAGLMTAVKKAMICLKIAVLTHLSHKW